jgi:hypothetical protein
MRPLTLLEVATAITGQTVFKDTACTNPVELQTAESTHKHLVIIPPKLA